MLCSEACQPVRVRVLSVCHEQISTTADLLFLFRLVQVYLQFCVFVYNLFKTVNFAVARVKKSKLKCISVWCECISVCIILEFRRMLLSSWVCVRGEAGLIENDSLLCIEIALPDKHNLIYI